MDPDASCASRPARLGHRTTRSARRSILTAASRWSPRSGQHSPSSKTLPVAQRPPGGLRHGAPDRVPGSRFSPKFSGARAGCGETPDVKLLSQLFGDRPMVANATRRVSIYGREPADHAADGQGQRAWAGLVRILRPGERQSPASGSGWPPMGTSLPAAGGPSRAMRPALADDILAASQPARVGTGCRARTGSLKLKRRLDALDQDAGHADLRSVVDHLVRRSVWIVGGDGGPTTSKLAASTTCWPAGGT